MVVTSSRVNPSLPLSCMYLLPAALFTAQSKTLSSVTQIRIDCPHVKSQEDRKRTEEGRRKDGSNSIGQKLCLDVA